jgi:hypothetical protein
MKISGNSQTPDAATEGYVQWSRRRYRAPCRDRGGRDQPDRGGGMPGRASPAVL